MFFRLAAVMASLVGIIGTLPAHDLWIEPVSFSPKPGQAVGVRLQVGQDLIGDPLPRNPSLVNQFIIQNAAGRSDVPGSAGADPAGLLAAIAPGLNIIGYQSHPRRIELKAEKFNQYLVEEGLEAVAAERARRGLAGVAAHELFARCAKSLIQSGPIDPKHSDRPLGFPLELVAERNPYAQPSSVELPVRLTYEGRPLKGALVVALSRRDPGQKLSARSDTDGRVRFRLNLGGMWLIKAVHMVPASARSKADWSSYWASLTFER
jgi:hypothetical protein